MDNLFLYNHSLTKFLRLSLKIRSPEVRSHRELGELRKIKGKIFLICPTPYSWDRTTSNNFLTPGPKRWTCSRDCPGGDGTGQIEPCIIRHAVRLSSVKTKGDVIVTKFLLNLRAQLRIRLVRSECLMEGSQTVVCISIVRAPAWRAR